MSFTHLEIRLWNKIILSDKEQKQENSRIYVLFYSFFLIPFMIAVFGAVFFLLFKFITYETNDAVDLLNQVKVGSASKRWQSAFELAKVLNDPDGKPLSESFKDQLATAYDRSIHDDPLVRSYLSHGDGLDERYNFWKRSCKWSQRRDLRNKNCCDSQAWA